MPAGVGRRAGRPGGAVALGAALRHARKLRFCTSLCGFPHFRSGPWMPGRQTLRLDRSGVGGCRVGGNFPLISVFLGGKPARPRHGRSAWKRYPPWRPTLSGWLPFFRVAGGAEIGVKKANPEGGIPAVFCPAAPSAAQAGQIAPARPRHSRGDPRARVGRDCCASRSASSTFSTKKA